MTTIGPKEAARRALRVARATRTPPAPPVTPKEPQMKTKKVTSPAKRGSAARKADKAKKARKPGKALAPAAAAPPVSGKRPDGLRVGSKEARMLDLVLQAGTAGITEAAICADLGWKRCRVTLGRVCEKAKAELTSTGQGAERKWSATMPSAKAA